MITGDTFSFSLSTTGLQSCVAQDRLINVITYLCHSLKKYLEHRRVLVALPRKFPQAARLKKMLPASLFIAITFFLSRYQRQDKIVLSFASHLSMPAKRLLTKQCIRHTQGYLKIPHVGNLCTQIFCGFRVMSF